MHKIVVLGSLYLAFGGLLAPAQTETDLENWMKQARSNMAAATKALEAEDGTEAAAAARDLVLVFQKVEDFWTRRGVESAMEFSKDIQTAAATVAGKADAGDHDAAKQTLKTVAGNCSSCHRAHRVKAADGTWTLK